MRKGNDIVRVRDRVDLPTNQASESSGGTWPWRRNGPPGLRGSGSDPDLANQLPSALTLTFDAIAEALNSIKGLAIGPKAEDGNLSSTNWMPHTPVPAAPS